MLSQKRKGRNKITCNSKFSNDALKGSNHISKISTTTVNIKLKNTLELTIPKGFSCENKEDALIILKPPPIRHF